MTVTVGLPDKSWWKRTERIMVAKAPTLKGIFSAFYFNIINNVYETIKKYFTPLKTQSAVRH